MTKSEKENEPGRGARVRSLRQWFRHRPIAVAVCLVALIGLALGWNWLAASGLLVVALVGLGCLLMCVLGMHSGHDKGDEN